MTHHTATSRLLSHDAPYTVCAIALLLIAGAAWAQAPSFTLEPIPGDTLTILADLRARGPELSPEDQDALLNPIRRQDAYAGYGPDHQHLIKHEIMTYLRRSKIDKDLLVDVLGIVAHNPNQPVVMRDYALQHTYLIVDAGDAVERGAALLTAALDWRDFCLAGTALRALVRLRQAGIEIPDGDTLERMALEIAQDSAAAPSSRTAAVQACDAMNVAEALPSLRAMAANPTPIPLRLAAIRALGRIGLPSDHELLRELSTQKGIHVFAARAALEAGRVTGPEGDGALPIRSRR